jgi:HAD superfamily hydrolase (TIGR01490 family)
VKAAFFDLDRTLLDVNSGVLWARHELKRRQIGPLQFAQAMGWALAYHLSLVDMNVMYRRALSHYRGKSAREIEAETQRWFLGQVERRLRPGARAALAEHRARGELLVVLTNASPYEAQIAAQRFGMDAWISNVYLEDERGCLLGDFEPPLCVGAGKLERAQRWSQAHGVRLSESTFYTDSYTDLQVLEAVAAPRVIAPDPRLRRIAAKRQWPILDWGKA